MKKSIFLIFAAILCATSASAWSYKTSANGWTASTSGFKSVTMNSGKTVDVVMLKNVGDGVNICQNDNGSGHTLYCKWTKASGDIFRGTARWNNGLYCDETVVVPGGKVYIKVGSGTQVQMTAGTDYTYTADVTFSTTGQSYTISGGTVSGATIKNENSMPSGGKPASLTMKNSYTSKNAGSVHIVFDLRTNKVTETADSEPEPEPTPEVYTVVGGSTEIFGSAWTPSATANDMTKQADGTYKLVKENVTLAASNIEYKVVKDHNWGPGEFPSSGNQSLQIEESGVYDITFTYTVNDKLTAEKTLKQAIVVLPTIELAGTMNGCDDWGACKKTLTPAEDNLTASITVTLAQQEYSFKIVKAGEWLGNKGKMERNSSTGWTFEKLDGGDETNCRIVADIAGDYTFTWTYETNRLTVTYPELPTPEYKDITVTVYAKEVPNIWWWNGGDQCPSTEELTNPSTGNKYKWDEAPAMEAVIIDGNTWYQKKFENVDVTKGGIKFKLQSADHSKNSGDPEFTATEDKCYDARVITAITETPCGQLPIGETPKVTYNVEVPAGTNTCYIAGDMNSWNLTEMTKVDDTHYTITIEGATTAHKYKYASGPDSDWKYVEVKADGSDVSNRIYNANDVVEKWKAVYDPSAPVYKYYIVGSMNEWNQSSADYGMTDDNEDGIYEKKLTLKNNDEFKVKGNDWYGFDAIEGAYVETSLSNESDRNIKITLDADKEVTVKFNSETKKITFDNLTEKAPVVEDLSKQPSVIYIKCDDWKVDNARFAAYFFGTEEKWVSMTDVDNDGIYEVVNDKKNKNVIFCRMNPANNENTWGENKSHVWNQSADLEIPTTTYLNYWTVTSTDDVWNKPTGKWMMLIGSGDNSEALAAADDQTVEEVYVNRSFTAGQLYTIALPFDLSDALTKTHLGNVIKFVQLDKDENDDLVLLFDDALGMAAGKPYLITPSVSVDGFVVNNVDIKNTLNNITYSTTGAQVTMEAVLSASKNATNNGRYWLASNTYLYNTSTALKSLRAVFNVQTTKANVRARVAFGENVETGVEDIFTTDTPVKAIVNGQLIIIRDGVKYNVQGQKL